MQEHVPHIAGPAPGSRDINKENRILCSSEMYILVEEGK